MSINPFVEDKQFEQGSTDPFYATGSISTVGELNGFTSALRNKVQIKLSIPVTSVTRMLSNSSSIYYLDVNNGTWSIPQKALSDIVGPFDKVAIRTDAEGTVALPWPESTRGSAILEDWVGFDPFGNPVASGSLDLHRKTDNSATNYWSQSSGEINVYVGQIQSAFNESKSSLQFKDLPKSVSRNPDYDATEDQLFTIPIENPFLIEKIVYQVPMCLGPGWFCDKTTACLVTSSKEGFTYLGATLLSSSVHAPFFSNVGGPGITFAIFSQKKYGTGSIRDLISFDLVTHEKDLQPTYEWFSVPQRGNMFLCVNGIVGSMSGNVTAVVKHDENDSYTGSILFKSTPSVSNGLVASLEYGVINGVTWVTASNVNSSLDAAGSGSIFTSPYLDSSWYTLVSIDTIGRGQTGFAPSGGSIFGGEYVVPQGDYQSAPNPYKYAIQDPALISDVIARGKTIAAENLATPGRYERYNPTLGYIQFLTKGYSVFSAKKNSPYLVYPGEKMLLAAAKTRPALSGGFDADITSTANARVGIATVGKYSYFNESPNNAGHDVQFNTGSIDITFYGSYVQANKEYIP
ncbi:MAG: hypothetical protein EBR82_00375 [Caulobacteraceae bacterium]|nr:hypothetical protein [Caulobacteraceae bacterium]